MSHDSRRLLSVIVIGLNEQDHLKASLEAVFAHKPDEYDLEVMYVDSGSTDRSVEIASAIPGVEVLGLDGGRPSAARARNVGLRRAKGEFVQLVDGDSVIQDGWLDKALGVLKLHPEVSCVFGRVIELHPDQSIYMKVCGLDWHMSPGERRTCGGNSMWRRAVITENGLFDEDLCVGEEPDLCYRVRHQGGRILCIDASMVTHDLGMHRFRQYWARAVNSGRGCALIAPRFWRNPEKLWFWELILNFAEPIGWLAIFLFGWRLFGAGGAVALILAWWLIRASQIAFTVRDRKLDFSTALIYGVHCQFVRLPAAIGQLKTFLSSR